MVTVIAVLDDYGVLLRMSSTSPGKQLPLRHGGAARHGAHILWQGLHVPRGLPGPRGVPHAHRYTRKGSQNDPNIRLQQTLYQVKFIKFNSNSWNMSPENIDQGTTNFGLAKTDIGSPSYEHLRK